MMTDRTWISVDDRLPERGIDVLACYEVTREVAWLHVDDGEWTSMAPLGRVTHWMPLPELPDRQEGAE